MGRTWERMWMRSDRLLLAWSRGVSLSKKHFPPFCNLRGQRKVQILFTVF